MVEKLRKLNPTLEIYDVRDTEFSDYGVIVEDIDTAELMSIAEKIELPESGSAYTLSVDGFEKLQVFCDVKDKIFGSLDTQLGYCYGHSNFLGGLEWHASSEFNLAVTDLVLMLAKRQDVKEGKLDSKKVKAFFVPKGTALEIFSTTLHFCPCETSADGFGCVVGLIKGTNALHESEKQDKLVFKQNKWLLVHNENTALIERGCVAGIYGENYKLNY